MRGRGKREIPEKTHRLTTSSGTTPACENPVTRPEIETGSPWCEASECLISRTPDARASKMTSLTIDVLERRSPINARYQIKLLEEYLFTPDNILFAILIFCIRSFEADLPWRSLLVRRLSGVRDVLGFNPRIKERGKREIPEEKKKKKKKNPASGIVRHDFHKRKFGSDPAEQHRSPMAQSVGAPPIWDAGGSGFESWRRPLGRGREADDGLMTRQTARGRMTNDVIRGKTPAAEGRKSANHWGRGTHVSRAAVAERLACSYSTTAPQVQSRAGPFTDFRMWESCRTMPLVDGFSRGSSVYSSPSLQRQDLSVKSRQNLFTQSHIWCVGSMVEEMWRGEGRTGRLEGVSSTSDNFATMASILFAKHQLPKFRKFSKELPSFVPFYQCIPPRRTGFNSRTIHSGFSQVIIVPYDASSWRVSRGSPVSPALSFRLCSILISLLRHRLSRPRCKEIYTQLTKVVEACRSYFTIALIDIGMRSTIRFNLGRRAWYREFCQEYGCIALIDNRLKSEARFGYGAVCGDAFGSGAAYGAALGVVLFVKHGENVEHVEQIVEYVEHIVDHREQIVEYVEQIVVLRRYQLADGSPGLEMKGLKGGGVVYHAAPGPSTWRENDNYVWGPTL
ncbi:hypothetical protein PR048_002463 [Dryococelus australis]|uniref:Uncharacterized protein n=1 Tax=Dryococelus australis TaxID=614101 RepID=A0ABQ9IKE0_9NEOP|nr:hypothetical protein PR048_002463 [Dryococelus australis]